MENTDSKSSKSTKSSKSVSTSSPTSSPTSSLTVCVGHCPRRLEKDELPVQEVVPLESRLKIIESMEKFGAKCDASFSHEYDLISKMSCDSLIQHMDTSLQRDVESQMELPVGVTASLGAEDAYESWIPFDDGGIENQYNKKLCKCGELGCMNEIACVHLLFNLHLLYTVKFYDHKLRKSLLH
jgi:hypothetical protein